MISPEQLPELCPNGQACFLKPTARYPEAAVTATAQQGGSDPSNLSDFDFMVASGSR